MGVLLLLSGRAKGNAKASSIFELKRIERLLIVNRTEAFGNLVFLRSIVVHDCESS